jgi:hypothetical protein
VAESKESGAEEVNPGDYYGTKEQIDYLRPHVERQYATYSDVRRLSQLEQFDTYHREKMEAAVKILDCIMAREEVEDFQRRIDQECDRRERRLQNLRQAGRAMEELRQRIGFEERMAFDFDTGKIIRTPMGDFWIAVRQLLEEFWTA